ncbi:hypothetical protein SNE40_014470 [Patella caerulea]|uniref:Uncharacterized protein n=1 Tax=Patella caerulea TaxID=87958 RepID=A0AAN8PHB3_PATCE
MGASPDSKPLKVVSENATEQLSAIISPKETEINGQQMSSTHSPLRNSSSTVGATENRNWPIHNVWTCEETLYLISLMQGHIENYDEMPKSIAELENKIRLGRGKQRQLWAEFTEKLCTTFEKEFDSKRVARKWQTLIDGFKKVVLNNFTTGKAPTKFAFTQK